MASEITEIIQDGGNKIYTNLICFAEGYEDYWDIKSVNDAKHFPYLKRVVLCYAKDFIMDDFRKLGIEACWA